LDLLIGQWVAINLLPVLLRIGSIRLDDGDFERAVFFAGGAVAVVLGALSDEEVEVSELLDRDAVVDKAIYNLDEELIELLSGDGTDFEMVQATDKELGDIVSDWSFGDI